MSDSIVDLSFALDAVLLPIAKAFLEKTAKIKSKLVNSAQAKDFANAISVEKETTAVEILADRYLRFRTLQSPKSKIYINEIYHPLRLFYSDEGRSELILGNTMIHPEKTLVITGKAGQGKTTTLRKLVCNEILYGKTIPIIIFLREIEWSSFKSLNEVAEKIPQIISDELKNIGIYIELPAILYLIETQSIRVFFDGFDEVPHAYRNHALLMINTLFLKHKTPSIVTTRPNTEITYNQSSSQNVDLMDLTTDDVRDIIKKNSITNDGNYIDSLLEKVNSSAFSSLLKTPILVDIFVTVYAALKKDPDNLSDFYKDLFIQLSENHDRFKTSLERSSFSGLNNEKLRDIFIATCAVMMNASEDIVFSESELIDFFKRGCDMEQLETRPSQVHQDIIDKTSLIIHDGRSYSFIHKTILEYHAAEFLKSRLDEKNQRELYSKFVEHGIDQWEQVILFLSEIDRDKLNSLYFKVLLQSLGLTGRSIHDYDGDSSLSYIPLLFGFSKIRFSLSKRNLPFKASVRIEEPNMNLYKQFHVMMSITKKSIPDIINHVKEKEYFSYLIKNHELSVTLSKDMPDSTCNDLMLSAEYLKYIEAGIKRAYGRSRTLSHANGKRVEDIYNYVDFELVDIIKSVSYEYKPALFDLIAKIESIHFDIDTSEKRRSSANAFLKVFKPSGS